MSAAAENAPRQARYLWALILLFSVVYVAPLGIRPLSAPDEVRYGEVAREMLRSGDWISPHLNGVRYFEKPVLGYWIDALSIGLLGESAFALRLPSALATGFTALLIFFFLGRFADRRSAFLASVIYLTTFQVLGVGTFAVLDAFLTLFLTAAIASYYLALRQTRASGRSAYLIASGGACGLAFLTKGFLAFAIPAIVIVPYLAGERAWRELLARPWLAVAACIAVVLPWAIAIQIREPDFWRYFFVVEHVQRFLGDAAQHAQPPWYYLLLLPAIAFPWAFFMPAAIAGLRRRGAEAGLVKYLAYWAIVPFAFFSLSRGKLPTYVLPCLPPLAMILGLGLNGYFSASGRRRLFKAAALLLGSLLAIACLALLASRAGVLGESRVYSAAETTRWLTSSVALGLAASAAIAVWFTRSAAFSLTAAASLILPIYVFTTFSLPERIRDIRMPGAFLRAQQASIPANAVLVSDAPLFGATSWFFDRDDVYVLSEGEIAYGLSYPGSRHRHLDEQDLAALLAENAARREIVIFCEEDADRAIRPLLPPRAVRRQRGQFILWRIPAQRSRSDG